MDIYEQMLIETIAVFDRIIKHRELFAELYDEEPEKFIQARDKRKKELALLRRRRTIKSKRAAP